MLINRAFRMPWLPWGYVHGHNGASLFCKDTLNFSRSPYITWVGISHRFSSGSKSLWLKDRKRVLRSVRCIPETQGIFEKDKTHWVGRVRLGIAAARRRWPAYGGRISLSVSWSSKEKVSISFFASWRPGVFSQGSLWIPDWLGYFAQICLLSKPEGRRITCCYRWEKATCSVIGHGATDCRPLRSV